jgi:hypothetical protein
MILKNPPNPSSTKDTGRFILLELYPWMRNVSTCLGKLQFDDNFVTFRVQDLLIPNGQSVFINNDFRTRFLGGSVIPSGRVIFRQVGNGMVTDGDWNVETLELINNGPSDTTISVIFFR